jgi:phage-related minor tail protein
LSKIPEAAGVDAEYQNIMTQLNASNDPWQVWYDYTYKTLLNKINNAKDGTDEYYAAQQELFDLVTEKSQRAKDKAEDMFDNLQKLFESMDETLKLRFAEERQTTKGDTFFIDVSKFDINPAMLKELSTKIRNNDPDAARMVEELKYKMLGVTK